MAIYTHEETDGNLLDSSKKEVIDEIKEIISNYGNFTIGEVEAECSPLVQGQKGNLLHLIECFNRDNVIVSVYARDEEVDEYSLSYKELDLDTLKEILDLSLLWEEANVDC